MKTYLTTIFAGFIISLMLIPSGLLAQNDNSTGAETLLEGYVQDFVEAYARKDKEGVLKHLSKKSQSTIFYFSIAENVRRQNSNYEGFSKYLDKLARSEGMEVSYDLKEILQNHVHGDVAVVVAVIDYELREEGGFHAKGKETVSFAWKKIEGKWQIVQFTVMGIEDEKLRGQCLCEIFSSSNGQYVVRTTVPAGRNYETSFNEFKTRKSGGDIYIKTSDHTTFVIYPSGEVWRQVDAASVVDKKDETQTLGKAGGVKEAILLIIKNYLHAGQCSQIKYSE